MFSHKSKFILMLVLVLFSLSFISSAEAEATVETGDPVQFVSSPELNMTGLQISRLKQSSGDYSIDFRGSEASLDVNGNKFENIKYNSNRPGTITVSKTGDITYAKFTTNENGGVYTIGGTTFEAPPNADVFYDSRTGKILITSNGDSVMKTNPSIADCSEGADCLGRSVEIYAKSGSVTLPSGHILESGKIGRDKYGKYYIPSKGKVVINGVAVNTYSKDRTYGLFFDSEGSGREYISFTSDTISGKVPGGIIIEFNGNNPYTKIEGGDYLKLSGTNGEFKLKSNAADGKISTLELYGGARVWNDGKFFEYDNTKGETIFSRGSKKYNERFEKTTSTPMEISFYNSDGNPVLKGAKTKNEYSILMDNYNRFAVIPKNAKVDFSVKNEGIDTTFSSRLRYNYVTEKELSILTGDKIKMEGGIKNLEDNTPEGEKSLLLGRARDYYNTLTQETKDSLNNIYLTNTKELRSKARYSALYNPETKDVYMSTASMDLGSFRHEMAHALDLPKDASIEFDEKWSKVYSVGETNLAYKWSGWTKLKTVDFPANGILRPYSYKNKDEHIATYLEPLSTNPAFFKDLVNPKSSSYDPKYMKSIDLLLEYNFISKEEYNAVRKEAGI